MLIDASHPEETRVAVVRGNRIEEFDFESQEKKQLRGNIYLAKVTRVEPSLQAAFVDYGGNRHGFLAFSEIHPDYYQIPVADRQALLEAEAEDARASREAEDAEDNNIVEIPSDDDDLEEEPTPKRKPRRRSRKAKTSEENSQEEDATKEISEEETAEIKLETKTNEAEVEEPSVEVEEEVKPKRRSTRRKKAPVAKKAKAKEKNTTEKTPEVETAEANAELEEKPKRRTTRRKKSTDVKTDVAEDTSTNNNDDDSSTTMAAMIETDSISEPLPEDADEPEDVTDGSDEEPAAEEKPKRKPTKRKAAPKKKAVKKDKAVEVETVEETSSTAVEPQETEETAEQTPKPKKRTSRRSPRKKKVEISTEENSNDEAETDNDSEIENVEDSVESVGQEDAMEEVPVSPRRQRRHYKIQEVIKRRQVLLVQVVKEERGNKGAALTTYLSLAGRYSVLMPNTARGGGISRKITNTADRKRLKAIATGLEVPAGMGVILRTAGASRTNVEIERDFDYLMRLWEQVRNLTLSSSAPCLVYEEGSLIKRSIRDLYDKDTGEVIVAGEDGFNEAKDFMNMLMPSATKKVKLHCDKQSIFAKFGVETQLDKMVTPQVTLKSGGYLIIDQTEALVAVDVNSGRSTREHSIESTALQTNLEAAEEVARQLRLRDLAGLIVIDFIDMEEKRNNRAVEKKLKDCLKNDRARIQVGRISHFGLMEMSRQRMRASVLESTMDVCSLCGGTGHVRSDSAIALHVFRAIEEHVSRHNRYDAIIKTTAAIAIHLLNHKRAALLDLENRYGLVVLIEGSVDIKGQDFIIEKGELASGEVISKAVGFQNNTLDGSEDDTSDNKSKNNRNRKRGKNRNDELREDTDESDLGTENTSSEDDNNEDSSRKKRRRGKRGGRKRQTDEETASTIESNEDTHPSVEVPSNTDEQNANSTSEEPTEEKAKSRSTTRRKAPIAKPVETDEQPVTHALTDADETQADKTKEKPRKTRRTTRRKAVDSSEESEETFPSENTTPETNVETSSQVEEEKPEETKKKKKGWWNRGGGFF